MEKQNAYIKGHGGWDLYLYQWNEVKDPVGAVQILHGMAEHTGRYKAFAEFLNKQGYVVYGHDHRGQGYSCKSLEELGSVGEESFNNAVQDANLVTQIIKKNHAELPVFIFAHSFGSFVGQEYITRYGHDIAGIILSGSAAQTGAEVSAGAFVAALQKRLFGSEKKGKLLNSLSFGSFNKRIKNPETSFDWLSRDGQEVSKYRADPRCGYVFSIGFYYYFFKGLKKLYQYDKLERIPLNLSIFILSGEEDPVGKYGQSVKKLDQIYRKLGLKAVELKLYSGGRHEMLNEINRDEVFMDIADWLNKNK